MAADPENEGTEAGGEQAPSPQGDGHGGEGEKPSASDAGDGTE